MGNVFDEYAELKVKEAEKEFQKKIKATKKAARKTTEQALQEKEKATAVNLLKKGIAIETIAEVLPSLSLEFIKQLKQQLPQA